MSKSFICTKNDWDHEVIDVFLVSHTEEFYLKGFDEEEWEEAIDYAVTLSEQLGFPFVGDRTDT